jgi:pSer/pThr/pTyr-binding forkhead associated (FHA) protein
MLRRITEHVDPGLPREVPLQPRLEEQQPTGRGLPQLRIGRHPNNDIVLTSGGIPLLLSRQHAVITYDGEQYTVVDQDTTNGTYVRARARCLRSWAATCKEGP